MSDDALFVAGSAIEFQYRVAYEALQAGDGDSAGLAEGVGMLQELRSVVSDLEHKPRSRRAFDPGNDDRPKKRRGGRKG